MRKNLTEPASITLQRPNLKYLDVALDRAYESFATGDRALDRFTETWRSARGYENYLGILAARSQLLDYLAAGLLLGETTQSNGAVDALLEQAIPLVDRFQPVREISLVKLSLAVATNRWSLAGVLAKAVLRGQSARFRSLKSFQARSLSTLVTTDYRSAKSVAADLKSARESKDFDIVSCSLGLHWATAIQRLADGDYALDEPVVELQRLHNRSIDRDLGKLQRGGASAFAPFDLLDLPVAALITLSEYSASVSVHPNISPAAE